MNSLEYTILYSNNVVLKPRNIFRFISKYLNSNALINLHAADSMHVIPAYTGAVVHCHWMANGYNHASKTLRRILLCASLIH